MKIIGVRMSAVAGWQEFQRRLIETAVPCRQEPDWWTSDDELERQEAAQMCMGCPLVEACRAFATTNREEFGIWGARDFTVKRRRAA